MKYYRVKSEYDGMFAKNGKIQLIGNELFTEREKKKLSISDSAFNEVNISKKMTYWLFGARFEI